MFADAQTQQENDWSSGECVAGTISARCDGVADTEVLIVNEPKPVDHHINDGKTTTNIHKTSEKLLFNLADWSRRVGKLFNDL